MTKDEKFDISKDNDIYLQSPTLKEVLRASEDLCHHLKVPYDPYKIKVTTDYGRGIVIYYKENDEI
jgi:hypothetical protein